LVSTEARNLALLIVGGLVVGTALSTVYVYGVPLTLLLLQSNAAVYHGAYWQLLTSLVVAPPDAGGVTDVLFNALALIWLDRLMAGAFEPGEYYAAFVLSGLAGNLASMLGGPDIISFGASGGIFGLLACAIAEGFVAERRFNVSLASWFLLVFAFSSFALPDVDWLAHLGGALFGALIGCYLGLRRRDSPL
jgi:rhomboid protease GluP